MDEVLSVLSVQLMGIIFESRCTLSLHAHPLDNETPCQAPNTSLLPFPESSRPITHCTLRTNYAPRTTHLHTLLHTLTPRTYIITFLSCLFLLPLLLLPEARVRVCIYNSLARCGSPPVALLTNSTSKATLTTLSAYAPNNPSQLHQLYLAGRIIILN